MSKVAFIGLGAMGSRMAANLLKAGHEVTVCDLVPEAVKKLASAGAKTAASPKEAAQGNDFVLTMVRDDEASRWRSIGTYRERSLRCLPEGYRREAWRSQHDGCGEAV
jgi:3-hydroxyacyl-CoA dehydrogenase